MEHQVLEFIITFGKHKGKELGDVPLGYLRWLRDEGTAEGTLKEVLEMYEEEIEDNPDINELTLRELL